MNFKALNADVTKQARKVGDIVSAYLKKDSKILVLGSGLSDMSEKMYEAGFHNIVNIDINQGVVQKMRRQHDATKPEMKWMVMDASLMEFHSGSFDVAIDKGMLDAVHDNKDHLSGAINE